MSEIRVLVLGALGMLGHRLVLSLPEFGYHVIGTARRGQMLTRGPGGLLELDAVDQQELFGVLDRTSPHAVVNCIGWVRQRSTAAAYAEAVHVNAVFPHWLDAACSQRGVGMIHLSTDCAGERDWYGVTKLQGEDLEHAVVIRTSFIGHQLSHRLGLLEWLLQQKGKVDGYAGVVWHGLTTNELAVVIGRYLIPGLQQLAGRRWDVAGPGITKSELLERINRAYNLCLEVHPVALPKLERRLDGQSFYEATGYRAPGWDEMLDRMKRERPVQVERVAA